MTSIWPGYEDCFRNMYAYDQAVSTGLLKGSAISDRKPLWSEPFITANDGKASTHRVFGAWLTNVCA